jgi:hypothetical protein
MFDKPITTIEQAKEYFRACYCSHFHMGHDGIEERNDEYKKLNISPYAVTIKQPLFDRNMWARSENLAKTATYLLRRVRNIS